MWLLNAKTLQLEEFFEAEAPAYAIPSHTWGEEEVAFQDMQSKRASHKNGYRKIHGCCSQAVSDGYEYVWVDTCWWVFRTKYRADMAGLTENSIDKTSSAELSEAINSMFRWYKNANNFYVYLVDVPCAYSVRDPCWGGTFDVKRIFKFSRWFRRGWTLQELIAPALVGFYAQDWSVIGTKGELRDELALITRIDIRILRGADLSTCNVAERMSWASFRETTRIEDKAYSLLGIFQVNMPLLYGEGGEHFFDSKKKL